MVGDSNYFLAGVSRSAVGYTGLYVYTRVGLVIGIKHERNRV